MAWYNEVNQEAPEDDADDKEPEAASGKRDGFGSDGVVPPWVQAASLLAPTSEAAESSAPASPTPPVVAASAAPSATPTPPLATPPPPAPPRPPPVPTPPPPATPPVTRPSDMPPPEPSAYIPAARQEASPPEQAPPSPPARPSPPPAPARPAEPSSAIEPRVEEVASNITLTAATAAPVPTPAKSAPAARLAPTAPSRPAPARGPMPPLRTVTVPAGRPTPMVVTHGHPVSTATQPPKAPAPKPLDDQPLTPGASTSLPVDPSAVRTTQQPPTAPMPPTGPSYIPPHPASELELVADAEAPSPISDMTGPISSGAQVPKQPAGPLKFEAGAWEYVPILLLTIILWFVPIFGWALQWQIGNKFIVEHLTIEGRRVTYTMTYGYALKVILRHLLMLIVTLGLGIFWLYVKEVEAVYAHVRYADEVEL